jgi:hypothetical protein
LKLNYDEPPSNFAFKFNLRRYITVRQLEALVRLSEALARMHCRADVQPRHVREARRQGLTLVHFPAQPEPFLTQSTPLKTPKPHSTP